MSSKPLISHTAAPLLSLTEMKREWAIMDVIFAYNQELNYAKKNAVTRTHFQLRDPSESYKRIRDAQEFHEWCPVKLTLSACVLANSILSVLN